MPRNLTYVTATGTSGVIVGEFTLVAVVNAAANTVIYVTDLVFASQNVTTFWIANQANVHISPAYLPAAGMGLNSFNTPLQIAGGTGILVRANSAASIYMEATWNGMLLS